MLKTTPADTIDALRESVATLPTDGEVRGEFFVQWRGRTIELLERLFPDDPEPARQFKEIEFSPRRLTRNEVRDEQLKLDAFLAGCAAARTLLESLIQSLTAPAVEAPPPEVQGEVQTPAVLIDATPLPEPEPDADGVITGGTMDTQALCAPVRGSLARVLGAWDKGDRDVALVLSAQLLADLTVLSRDERFKGAFDKVVGTAFDHGASDAVKAAAPLCMWSLVAAMNEVMKN